MKKIITYLVAIVLISTSIPSQAGVADSIKNCKIQDVSNPDIGTYGGGLYGGFNDKTKPVPSSGTVTWYLVPIDFTDLKGETNWKPRVEEQMKLLTEYYDYVSYGKLKIQWKIYDNWITMPGNQEKFQVKQSGNYDTTENFWKEAISLADSKIDFTGVQVVNFVLPKNQTAVLESAQGFPWTGDINKYNSSETKLASFTILGQFFEARHRTYWSYWAHEYGHTLGIPHISGSRSNSTYQQYDLMGNQDARREISGWTRFAVTKWLEDKWVYCKNKSSISSEIVNLSDLNSKNDGVKLVVIPISSKKALIAESRSKTKFTGQDSIQGNTEGVLVYVYDATIGHNSNYLFPATTASDPVLLKGESVTYEGVSIKVLNVGSEDKILIGNGSESVVTASDVPTLAVLDTALDTSIPIIKSKLIGEACILDWASCPNGTRFMEGENSVYLPQKIISNKNFNHGTQMVSAAIQRNPDMNILFVRIIGNTKSGARQSTGILTLTNALDWVYKNKDKYNVSAISVSQGSHNVLRRSSSYCPITATNMIIDRLYSAGIPVFFPTGNNGDTKRIDWPACIPSAIAVGGVEVNGINPQASTISNYDDNLVDIWSEIKYSVVSPGNKVGVAHGTSIANQLAASDYIALKNKKPYLTLDQALSLIKLTAMPIPNTLNQKILMFNLKAAINE